MEQLSLKSFVEQKSKSNISATITPELQELLNEGGYGQGISSGQGTHSVVEVSTFIATTFIGGQEVKVSFDGDEIEDKTFFIEFINHRLQEIEASQDHIHTCLVKDLLELKNTTWIENRQLTAEEFISKLSLSEIVFYADRSIVIHFDDGKLFGGHFINLQITADFQLGKSSI